MGDVSANYMGFKKSDEYLIHHDGTANALSRFTLANLVTDVLVQQNDTPSTGYTTYTLQKNIRIESSSDWSTLHTPIYLPPGTVFDGNGFKIEINREGSPAESFPLFELQALDAGVTLASIDLIIKKKHL